MKRLPLIPTLFTFIAVAAMIALGMWQLQRRTWKHEIIARLEAASTLPPLTPPELRRAVQGRGEISYRRAELVCRPGRVLPYDVRPGASRSGDPGYLLLVACAGETDPAIVAAVGWTNRPDAVRQALLVDALLTGMIVQNPYGTDARNRPRFLLIADRAVPPLLPARLPSPADLPDNHLSYALQWFAFATTLLVIYGLWMRRHTQSRVAGGSPAA